MYRFKPSMRIDSSSAVVSRESLARKHESGHPNLRNAVIVAMSVALMIALCVGTAGVLVHEFARSRPMQWMQPLGLVSAPDLKPLHRFPPPNLEIDDGHGDLSALQFSEKELLNSYGWIDRSNKVVRIPIDRALDLIAKRGFYSDTNDNRANGKSPLELIQNRPSQR
jgi:hypothetical protein